MDAKVYYLTFTLDTTDEIARAVFEKKFCAKPAEVTRDHNAVWAGPAPAKFAPDASAGSQEVN
jgi:hypothetical protein